MSNVQNSYFFLLFLCSVALFFKCHGAAGFLEMFNHSYKHRLHICQVIWNEWLWFLFWNVLMFCWDVVKRLRNDVFPFPNRKKEVSSLCKAFRNQRGGHREPVFQLHHSLHCSWHWWCDSHRFWCCWGTFILDWCENTDHQTCLHQWDWLRNHYFKR